MNCITWNPDMFMASLILVVALQHQALTCTSVSPYFLLKNILKCHLQNVSHFVQAWMC